ncbi:hypothetical protein E2C01_008124 [Portunus trituberculatus]|uniref:Uncharacterized protein n=1 Tax=Portunus trituberculatus TaxID=210409 RepID=A0A5B7D000_PORTR|nr:hypothetical protein [Portunus trituberculatus]
MSQLFQVLPVLFVEVNEKCDNYDYSLRYRFRRRLRDDLRSRGKDQEVGNRPWRSEQERHEIIVKKGMTL